MPDPGEFTNIAALKTEVAALLVAFNASNAASLFIQYAPPFQMIRFERSVIDGQTVVTGYVSGGIRGIQIDVFGAPATLVDAFKNEYLTKRALADAEFEIP